MMGTGQGIFCPPEGLSVEGQARWWLSELDMFMVAHNSGIIPANVMAAIEQITKDNDLAHKIIDEKKVRGLTNGERSRLFHVLTNGGEWAGRKQGPATKTIQDLRLAYEVREVSDTNTRKALLTDAIIKLSGVRSEDALYRRLRRIEQLWQSVCHYKPEVIANILDSCSSENISITNETIHRMAELLNAFYELPEDEIILVSTWLNDFASQADS